MAHSSLAIKDEPKQFLSAAFRMDRPKRKFSWDLLRESIPALANGTVVVYVDAFAQKIPTDFVCHMMSELTKLNLTSSLSSTGYVVLDNLSTQVIVDPDPKIGNTNIPIYRLAALAGGGMSVDQIAEDFPSLTKDQISDAIRYAKVRPHASGSNPYPAQSLKRLLRNSGFAHLEKTIKKSKVGS